MANPDQPLKRTADLIKSGKARNIVVLTGAGISTSAGIPDFRSPETGLYANLERLNLPFPEAVFELGYFKRNPVPFWTLAKDLYPGKYLPTPTHYFLTLLHAHSILLRTFTQNIDTLESLSGLPSDKIVEAHGSFASAHCLSCKRAASREYVLRAGVREGKVVRCEEEGKGTKRCGGLVKPDIVFFGEGLPDRFFERMGDLKKADLVIVIGTSLQVQPFASLPEYCPSNTPRLLINREPVGPFSRLRQSSGRNASKKGGLADLMAQLGIQSGDSGGSDDDSDAEDEEEEDDGRDMYWEGDADEGIRILAECLGWEKELEKMIKDGQEGLRKKWAEDGDGIKEDVAQGKEVDRCREIVSRGEDRIGETAASAGEYSESEDRESGEEDEEEDGKVPDDEVKKMGTLLAQQLAGPRPTRNDDEYD